MWVNPGDVGITRTSITLNMDPRYLNACVCDSVRECVYVSDEYVCVSVCGCVRVSLTHRRHIPLPFLSSGKKYITRLMLSGNFLPIWATKIWANENQKSKIKKSKIENR